MLSSTAESVFLLFLCAISAVSVILKEVVESTVDLLILGPKLDRSLELIFTRPSGSYIKLKL